MKRRRDVPTEGLYKGFGQRMIKAVISYQLPVTTVTGRGFDPYLLPTTCEKSLPLTQDKYITGHWSLVTGHC